MANKTKIVLDSDVVIHFIKAGQFSLLLDIFPEYQYLLLDVVYDEVTKHRETKTQIDPNSNKSRNKERRINSSSVGEVDVLAG